MNKDQRAQAEQRQPEQAPARGDSDVAALRTQLDATRASVYQLACVLLKTSNSCHKCRNCPRLAIRSVTAANRDFGVQDMWLCDGCELTDGWRSTGTVLRISDPNLLETIRIANEFICSPPR